MGKKNELWLVSSECCGDCQYYGTLGGGDWNVVCQIIREELSDRNVLICKLPKTKGEKNHG